MTDLVTSPTPPSGSPNVTTQIATSGGVAVNSGQLLYSTTLPLMFGNSDFDYAATSYTLTNAGTIWDDVAGGAQVFDVMNWGTINNSGLIVAHSSGGAAQTIMVTSSFTHGLTNSGSIYALSDTEGAIAFADWSDAPLTNSGTIAARGAKSATAIDAFNGAVIVNSAGGSILAEGADAIAIALGRGQFQVSGQPPTTTDVTNWGTIAAQSTGGSPSVAIYGSHLAGESMVIDNHGTISGDYAIFSDSYAFSPPQASADIITNESDGAISGEIYLDLGDDRIVNNGQISGYIDMGDGNDFVDMRLGFHAGDTELGWGNDTYLGGAGSDVVTGNRGDDFISGGGGNDLLLGGWGNDTIEGNAGNDGLYGEGGNDTITTSGGDFVDAGDGNDRVVLGDYTFSKVVGGSGYDILVLPTDGRILSLSLVASSGRVSGFEEIDLAAAGHIVVHASDIAALSGGTTLTIGGLGTGIVDLAGTWTIGASQTIGGVPFDSYSSGGSQLLVAHSLTVNLGSDPAGAAGLDAVAGGAPPLLAGSVPGADLTSNTVIGGVELTSNLEIYAGEHWISSTGQALVDNSTGGTTYELINRGTLDSSNANGAVAITGDYTNLSNYGTINVTGSSATDQLAGNQNLFNTYGIFNLISNLAGNSYGFDFSEHGAQNFLNTGVVTVQNSQAMAVGYLDYGQTLGTNQGTISASSSNFIAAGVFAHNGGTFSNSGTITANGGWGAFGVGSSTFPLDLTNSGTITAHSTDNTHPAIGVYFYYSNAGNHIANSGTITGDIAVETAWTVNGNSLWLDNSGHINGAIQLGVNPNGGPTADDVVLNTGTINGAVWLGGGDDVYDGKHGIQSGAVHGEDGNDVLIGTPGADVLDGGNGDDVLVGGSGDTLTGGAGNDIFVITSAGAGQTTMSITDFGNGNDILDLRALAPSSVTINGSIVTAVTASGTLAIDTHASSVAASSVLWSGSQVIGTGTSGDDVLVAAPGGSTLHAADGFDLLVGGAGNDILDGGPGGVNAIGVTADVMVGGDGNDTYLVDSTADLVVEAPNGGIDTIQQVQGLYNLPIVLPENVENFVGWNGIGNDLANVMTGTAGGDILDGKGGNDTLIGSDGADTLTGGAGADTLTGGAGNDIFIDTAAGLNGDTITDFSEGDRIIITDATLKSFTFSVTGNTLTFTGGSLTLGSGVNGTIVARQYVSPYGDGVQLLYFPHQVHNDFNGDGRSDVLFRDSSTGQFSVWLGSSTGALTAPGPYDPYAGAGVAGQNWGSIPIPSGWQVAGTGDFNGDGHTDILLRNSGGSISDWASTVSGGLADNSANSFVSVDNSWHVAGVGDFNADGRSDILWRNDNGVIYNFLGKANAGFVNNGDTSYVAVDNSWHVAATGDFNGDGSDDILWRNDNGNIFDFVGTSAGGFVNNGDASYVAVDNSWHIVGVADFNGDGRADILWRNDNGAIFDFLGTLNGGFVSNGDNSYVAMDNSWHVAGTGDFNGDGRADILWRNDNGAMFEFLGTTKGGFVSNGDNSWVSVSTNLHVQDPLF